MRKTSLLVAIAFAFVSLFGTQALAARDDADRGTGTTQQGALPGRQDAGADREKVGVAEPTSMRVSNITGAVVNNLQGERLGTVQDLVVGKEGEVEYMILSHGGLLGVGDRLFAIPWEAVRPGAEANTFMLDIDRQRLANAPNFDRNTWPNFADPDVQHLYYGYYFTEGDRQNRQKDQDAKQ